MHKRFNISLFIACLLGGVIGSIISQNIYRLYKETWNPIILVGIYFATLVFCILFLGVVSEFLTNHISVKAWDIGTLGRTAGLVVLIPLLGFFLLGGLLQFIYGLGEVKQVSLEADDYIVMIDNSGSTADTDVKEERFSSVVDFVKSLDNSNRIMISVFDDQNQIILPLTQKQDGLENKVQEILDTYDANNGTDIQKALSESLDAYTAGGKRAIAILFSDGESSVDVKRITDRYLTMNIPVFTVGFAGHSFGGKRLLNSIANKTGGNYYEINNMNSFQSTYSKIVDYKAKRILLDYRTVKERKSILFGTERVLFIVILFTVLGPVLGIVFDSEEILKTNTIFRIITGLIAGIILEVGLQNYVSNTLLCILLCILMSLVISNYRTVEYETPQITGYDVNAFTYNKNNFGTGKNNSGSSSTFKTDPNETKEFFITDHNIKRNNKDKTTFR